MQFIILSMELMILTIELIQHFYRTIIIFNCTTTICLLNFQKQKENSDNKCITIKRKIIFCIKKGILIKTCWLLPLLWYLTWWVRSKDEKDGRPSTDITILTMPMHRHFFAFTTICWKLNYITTNLTFAYVLLLSVSFFWTFFFVTWAKKSICGYSPCFRKI